MTEPQQDHLLQIQRVADLMFPAQIGAGPLAAHVVAQLMGLSERAVADYCEHPDFARYCRALFDRRDDERIELMVKDKVAWLRVAKREEEARDLRAGRLPSAVQDRIEQTTAERTPPRGPNGNGHAMRGLPNQATRGFPLPSGDAPRIFEALREDLRHLRGRGVFYGRILSALFTGCTWRQVADAVGRTPRQLRSIRCRDDFQQALGRAVHLAVAAGAPFERLPFRVRTCARPMRQTSANLMRGTERAKISTPRPGELGTDLSRIEEWPTPCVPPIAPYCVAPPGSYDAIPFHDPATAAVPTAQHRELPYAPPGYGLVAIGGDWWCLERVGERTREERSELRKRARIRRRNELLCRKRRVEV